jgi:lysophospholipase L1-like esterase
LERDFVNKIYKINMELDVPIYRQLVDSIHAAVKKGELTAGQQLPTVQELIDGLKGYIALARSYGYKVYVGTLLPMGGWRTDAPFRQEMRHAYNDFIRTTDLIDGCIDFDMALRDPLMPDWFLPEYDSGDHLHPSEAGYRRMAMEIPASILK